MNSRDGIIFADNELSIFGNREDDDALGGGIVIVPKMHREAVCDPMPAEVKAICARSDQVCSFRRVRPADRSPAWR